MDDPGNKEARVWAMLAHLSALAGHIVPFGHIIAPVVIWMLKKDEFPFVDQEGKESINFQITITIYAVVAGLLIFVLIGILLLPAVLLFNVIAVIIAGIRASDGRSFRYPLTIRFIK